MSALSYLGSRVALMVKVPPVPSSLAGTFFDSGGAAIVFLHLPAVLDGASSTAAQHSEEVRLPEWASELLPDLVFFFPPGSFSGKCLAFCYGCCFPVDLVGTDKSIVLVAGDRDDTYRAWHFQYVVRIVRGCHQLGECETAKDSIVR